jgi:hypothetical protein
MVKFLINGKEYLNISKYSVYLNDCKEFTDKKIIKILWNNISNEQLSIINSFLFETKEKNEEEKEKILIIFKANLPNIYKHLSNIYNENKIFEFIFNYLEIYENKLEKFTDKEILEMIKFSRYLNLEKVENILYLYYGINIFNNLTIDEIIKNFYIIEEKNIKRDKWKWYFELFNIK